MKRVLSCSIGLGICLAGASASAQIGKVDNIGNAGGIVIGAERLVGVYVTKTNVQGESTQTAGGITVTVKSDVETTRTTFALFGHDPQSPTQVPRLALDFFPIDGLSIGGSFTYIRTGGDQEGNVTVAGGGVNQTQDIDQKLTTESALIFQPRIGYAIAFDETVGLWPRLGFSYSHLVSEDEVTQTDPQGNQQKFEETTTGNFTNLSLEVMLFISPFSNFAFVGGPFVDIPLGGGTELESTEPNTQKVDADTTFLTYGATIGVAGYFDTQ